SHQSGDDGNEDGKLGVEEGVEDAEGDQRSRRAMAAHPPARCEGIDFQERKHASGGNQGGEEVRRPPNQKIEERKEDHRGEDSLHAPAEGIPLTPRPSPASGGSRPPPRPSHTGAPVSDNPRSPAETPAVENRAIGSR